MAFYSPEVGRDRAWCIGVVAAFMLAPCLLVEAKQCHNSAAYVKQNRRDARFGLDGRLVLIGCHETIEKW